MSDLRQLGVDLHAALLGGFGSLPQLQELELEVMASPLLRRKRHALGVVALLRIVQLGFDGRQRRARRLRGFPRVADPALELAELTLACEHAVQVAVRREKADRLRGDEMALRRHEGFAHRERMPVANRRTDVVAAAHASQPVGEEARDLRRHAVYARIQRVGGVRLAHPSLSPARS